MMLGTDSNIVYRGRVRSMRARLPAALLAALTLLPAAVAAADVALTLKLFPIGCEVTIDGVAAKPLTTQGALRTFRLPKALFFIGFSAPGYLPRDIAVELSSDTMIEAKLEREGSGLVWAAEMPTGRQPKCVEYTPDGRYILSALLEGTGIDVFDAKTFAKITTLVPPDPWPKAMGFVEIAFLPGRGELWVTQMHACVVHAFRLADFSYVDTFKAGGLWPKAIAVSADERTAYVSNWESKVVSVIDTASREVTSRIAMGGIPRGMAFSHDGRFLYVCIYEPGSLVKVDRETNGIVKTITVGSSALRHVVLHPTRDVLYVSDLLHGRVFAIDTATDTVVARAVIDACLNTIRISPDGERLFACSRGPNNPVNWTTKGPAFGKLYCLDPLTLAVTDWAWGGNQPTGLGISPDGRFVCFSDFLDARLEVYEIAPAVEVPAVSAVVPIAPAASGR
jgi:YVTN family beta-propeller protein